MLKKIRNFEKEYGEPLLSIRKILNGMHEKTREMTFEKQNAVRITKSKVKKIWSRCQIGKEQDLVRSEDLVDIVYCHTWRLGYSFEWMYRSRGCFRMISWRKNYFSDGRSKEGHQLDYHWTYEHLRKMGYFPKSRKRVEGSAKGTKTTSNSMSWVNYKTAYDIVPSLIDHVYDGTGCVSR